MRALVIHGASVFVGIAVDTPRTLEGVLTSNSLNGISHVLERTRLPLRLVQSARFALGSRAQARRLADGLAAFREVGIDFACVDELGHGFADELFRVQAGIMPSVELRAITMSSGVAALLHSVGRASGLSHRSPNALSNAGGLQFTRAIAKPCAPMAAMICST